MSFPLLPWLSGVLLAPTLALGALPPPGEFHVVSGGVRSEVRSWGPDCGPQPGRDPRGPGLTYTLTADGALVSARRGAPTLFTPGLCRRVSGLATLHEARPIPTAIGCRSADDAPKRVDGTARIAAEGPDVLQVTQRFGYDWRLKGSHCEVTLVGQWKLARVQPTATVAPPPAETPREDCASPGDPVKLEVLGGSRRHVRAGGRLQLEARAVDAAGCPLAVPVRWTTSVGRIDASGLLDAAELEPGGVVEARASLGPLTANFRVQVTAASGDLAALLPATPGSLANDGAPRVQHAATGTSGGRLGEAEGRSTPGEESSDAGVLIGVFIGFGLTALLIGGYVASRAIALRRGAGTLTRSTLDAIEQARQPTPRVRPRPALPSPASATSASTASVSATTTGAAETVAPGAAERTRELRSPQRRACLNCDRRFDAQTRFCPYDGERLEDMRGLPGETDEHGLAEQVTAPGPPPRGRICPSCGTHYPLDARFCGRDGVQLVLLN